MIWLQAAIGTAIVCPLGWLFSRWVEKTHTDSDWPYLLRWHRTDV